MQAPNFQKFLSDSRERYSFQLLLKIERSLTFFCPKKKRFHFSVAVCNILAKNDCFIGLMLQQQPGGAVGSCTHWWKSYWLNAQPFAKLRRPRKVAALFKTFSPFFSTLFDWDAVAEKRKKGLDLRCSSCGIAVAYHKGFLFEGLFASFSRTKADLTLKIFLLLHFKLFYLHCFQTHMVNFHDFVNEDNSGLKVFH